MHWLPALCTGVPDRGVEYADQGRGMKTAYDVIVIGGGPAGALAARTTAQAGLATLLLEKRQEIGSPVRCGEAVGRDTVARFLPLDARWIAAEIDTFSLSNAQGDCVVLPPLEETLVLERKIFDRELVHAARQAGADVMVKARATGLLHDGQGVAGVSVMVQGEPHDIPARIVIGADGTEAQSTRWAGLTGNPPLRDYFSAVQYLLSGVDIPPRICQYHLGQSLAPGGYVWVFPKGPGKANVGLVLAADAHVPTSAIGLLDAFVAARFPQASPLAQVVGGIHVTNTLARMVTDGYMAVGDAAHQADPLTGGGITNGMHGGLFAGEVAVAAVRAGDVSARFLHRYEERWDAEFGRLYRRLLRIRRAVRQLPSDATARMITQATRLDTSHVGLRDLFTVILKSYPSLLIEVLPYFLGQ